MTAAETTAIQPVQEAPHQAGVGPFGPKPRRISAGRIGIYAFLIVAALFFLIPVYIMIVTSLKGMPEIRLGHPDNAEAYLRKALEEAPAQIQTYAKLAGLAVARKDLDGAERILKQATQ
jgi:ABC-type glycerol-3-phosphate transport system permease component